MTFRPGAVAAVLALAMSTAAFPALAKTAISIGLQQEPTSLDLTSDATASIDGMLSQNLFESLGIVLEDGTVVPNLASAWTISDDGLTYTFKLHTGVKFHDGTDFDAEDVKFTIDRARGEGSTNASKAIFAGITDVVVTAPDEVVVTLKAPDAFFLFNMAQGDASIVAPESVDLLATAPVGTGPFKFDSWTRGDRLTLVKNADWRDAATVAMERITFRFIADAAAASAAMLSDEIDAFPGFPAPELLPQFEADPRFAVSVGSTEGEVILAINNSKAPFTDIRVRRAISHAIDRAAIIDGAMYGRAQPIGSFYPPHGAAYVDLTGVYPHDAAKARALFDEAGVAVGTEMLLRVPPFPYATRSAEIIQAQLAKAGITVKVENVEWGFWLEEVFRGQKYDLSIIAHTSPNDLGNFARGPGYFYGYDSPEFVALWDRIKTEANPEARAELTREAQRYLTDQAVHGFLFQMPKLMVNRRELGGFWLSSPVLAQPLAGITWTD